MKVWNRFAYSLLFALAVAAVCGTSSGDQASRENNTKDRILLPRATNGTVSKAAAGMTCSSLNESRTLDVKTRLVSFSPGAAIISCHRNFSSERILPNFLLYFADNTTLSLTTFNISYQLSGCFKVVLPISLANVTSTSSVIPALLTATTSNGSLYCGSVYLWNASQISVDMSSLKIPTGALDTNLTVNFSASIIDLATMSSLIGTFPGDYWRFVYYILTTSGTTQGPFSVPISPISGGNSSITPFSASIRMPPRSVSLVAFHICYVLYNGTVFLEQEPLIRDFSLGGGMIKIPNLGPPLPLAAQMTADSINLYITFDAAVEIQNATLNRTVNDGYFASGSTSVPCSVFMMPTVYRNAFPVKSLYNRSSDCTAAYDKSSSTLKLTFPGRSGLDPDDIVVFRANTIRKKGTTNMPPAPEMRMTISSTSVSSIPVVSVVSNPFIGPCDPLSVDVSAVGSGNRKFISNQIDIRFANGTTNSALQSLSSMMSRILDNDMTGKKATISVSSQTLKSGSYILIATFVNYLKYSGNASMTFQKETTDNIPSVTISGLSGDWTNSQYSPTLVGTLTQNRTVCNNSNIKSPQYTMTWNVTSEYDNIVLRSSGSSILLDVAKLYPQTAYTAILTIKSDERPAKYFTYAVPFTTPSDDFDPSIGGSKTMTLSRGYVRASISSSYTRFNRIRNMSYQWSCVTFLDGLPCLNSAGGNVSFPSTNNTIYLAALLPGQYSVGLNATCTQTGLSVIESPIKVTLVVSSIPSFNIIKSKVNPSWNDANFSLKIQRDDSVYSLNRSLRSFDAFWTSVSSCNDMSATVVDMTDQSLFAAYSGIAVKFKPSVLIPGAYYCIQVVLTDKETRNIAQALTSFRVRDIPSYGTCLPTGAVNSSQGLIISDNDTFNMVCSNWTTDSLSQPIIYSLEARQISAKKKKGSIVTLLPNSLSSTLSVNFFSGTYQVRVKISDASGSAAPSQPWYQLIVNPSNITSGQSNSSLSNSVKELAQESLDVYVKDKDANKLVTKLSIVAGAFDSLRNDDAISNADANDIKVSGLKAISNLLNDTSVSNMEEEISDVANLVNTFVNDNSTGNITTLLAGADALNATAFSALGTKFNSFQNLNDTIYNCVESMSVLIEQHQNMFGGKGSKSNNASRADAHSVSSKLKGTKHSLIDVATSSSTCGEALVDISTPYIGIYSGSAPPDQSNYKQFTLLTPLPTVLDQLPADSCVSYASGYHVASSMQYANALDVYQKRDLSFGVIDEGNQGINSSAIVGTYDMVYFLSFIDENGTPYTSNNIMVHFVITMDDENVRKFKVGSATDAYCARYTYADTSVTDPSQASISFANIWTNNTSVFSNGSVSITCQSNGTAEYTVVFVQKLGAEFTPDTTNIAAVTIQKISTLFKVSVACASVAFSIFIFLTTLYVRSRLIRPGYLEYDSQDEVGPALPHR